MESLLVYLFCAAEMYFRLKNVGVCPLEIRKQLSKFMGIFFGNIFRQFINSFLPFFVNYTHIWTCFNFLTLQNCFCSNEATQWRYRR
mmetsp:Transcript_25668/g.44769  ORF Transcript_25668/g.44769 Transcript_25668/m.44769 type:complete len:87 (+) Transcript_25668:691-951(+)